MSYNAKSIMILMMIIHSVSNAQDPTHYSSNTDDNKIEIVRYTPKGPNERLVLDKKVEQAYTLPFVQSKEGKLLYLEIPSEHRSITNDCYSHAKKERLHLYDSKRVAQILHVCDTKGHDINAVPIIETATYASTYARFYGENYVGLQYTNRFFGHPRKILFISLIDNSAFEIGLPQRDTGDNFISATSSPDGLKLLSQIYIEKNAAASIFLNGKQIYPFYSEEIPDQALHPDEYNRIIENSLKWLKENPGQYKLSGIHPDKQECWSPDSRYFALWRTKPPQPGGTVQVGRKELDLQYVVFDTDNITTGKQVSDYTTVIDAGIKLKDIQNSYDDPKVVWDKETNGLYFAIENTKTGNRKTKAVLFEK